MSKLEHHLEAARGWLLLSNPQEAERELDAINEVHRCDARVLMVQTGVFHQLERWEQLRAVAQLLCDTRPLDPQWPVSLAIATRHLEGPEQAIGILMDTIQAFPKVPGAYYDLACCEAVLGNVDLARGWLKKAFRLDPGFREKVLYDPDLVMFQVEL